MGYRLTLDKVALAPAAVAAASAVGDAFEQLAAKAREQLAPVFNRDLLAKVRAGLPGGDEAS